MRKIPTSSVWKALGLPPKEKNSSGRKIVNSFDVCMARGMSFSESADFLARHFPEVLKNQDTSIDVQGMLEGVKAEGVKISPENRERAEQIALTMGALRADRLNLTVKSDSHLVSPEYLDQSLSDICKKLDLLPDTGILASPVFRGGKRAIIISSVKPGLYRNFPDPNLRLSTEKGEQAVYVLSGKSQYDEFYDYLNDRLNGRFGDPAQPVMIQIPGLSRNVKIISTSQNECKELDQYARTVYEQWKSGATEAKLPELDHDSLYNNREAARLEEKLVEEGIRERNRLIDEYFDKKQRAMRIRIMRYQTTIIKIERIIQKPTPELMRIARDEARLLRRQERVFDDRYPGGGMGVIERELRRLLEILDIAFDAWLLRKEKELEMLAAEIFQDKKDDLERVSDVVKNIQIKLNEGAKIARRECITVFEARQIDILVGRKLYAAGATPDEVYSFMKENGSQCEYIENGKALEKACKRIAVNSAPANLLGNGSNWRSGKKPCRARPAATPGIDLEQDRKRPQPQSSSHGKNMDLSEKEKRNA